MVDGGAGTYRELGVDIKAKVLKLTALPVTDNQHPIICLACYHRQRSLFQPCQKCGSRRLAHVAFLRQN